MQATSGQHLLNLIKEKNLGVITTIIDKFESASKKYANFVDKDNNIWIGTREVGLYRYDGKTLTAFTEKPINN